MVPWDRFKKEKLEIVRQALTVHDIGGGAGPQNRKHYQNYVLVDVDASYRPDVVADIQALPFADNSLEAVLCFDVLEHVERPWLAVAELHRTMKPGAPCILAVPFLWAYHAAPGHYHDYWRFSADALRSLFKDFSSVEIVKRGGLLTTIANLIPSYTYLDRLARPVTEKIDELIGSPGSTRGYFVYVVK
jgi:SAM-dependent methyltransferase